jgi:hypothetical protein
MFTIRAISAHFGVIMAQCVLDAEALRSKLSQTFAAKSFKDKKSTMMILRLNELSRP